MRTRHCVRRGYTEGGGFDGGIILRQDIVTCRQGPSTWVGRRVARWQVVTDGCVLACDHAHRPCAVGRRKCACARCARRFFGGVCAAFVARSEERRVGEECTSQWESDPGGEWRAENRAADRRCASRTARLG